MRAVGRKELNWFLLKQIGHWDKGAAPSNRNNGVTTGNGNNRIAASNWNNSVTTGHRNNRVAAGNWNDGS